MVGPARFELATSYTPCKRATRLRYGPTHKKEGYLLTLFGNGKPLTEMVPGEGVEPSPISRPDPKSGPPIR